MHVEGVIERAVAELEPSGHLVAARRLTGGVSADVFGLVIATAGGETRRVVFCRHRHDGFEQHGRSITQKEHGVLRALHREGFAVPEPFLCSDPDGADGAYMLMDWIDGTTDVAAADLSIAVDQMATFLVELHSVDTGSLQPAELEPVEDPLTAMIEHLPNTQAGDRVRALLAAGSLARGPARSVLLHGDFWPGNIIWRDRVLVAVIDWEDACLGDPLADVATARVELLCQHGADAMQQFTARYFASPADVQRPGRQDRSAIWELSVSAAALSKMAGWGLEPTEEARRRRLTEGFFERAAHELDALHG